MQIVHPFSGPLQQDDEAGKKRAATRLVVFIETGVDDFAEELSHGAQSGRDRLFPAFNGSPSPNWRVDTAESADSF